MTLQKHLYHAIQWKGERTGIIEMRRHYTNYLKGLPDVKSYRQMLVEANSVAVVEAILAELVDKLMAA